MPADLPPPFQATTWHYERSNADGSEAEQVYVHRAAPDRLAVYKMRERCTGAALVTAEIDPATGEATKLIAGRLTPAAQQRPIGEIAFDPKAATLAMTLTMDGRTVTQTAPVGARPWHLYDYDLATLTIATQARRNPRAGFSFGLALVWPETPDKMLQWLGRADAKFVRTEQHEGRKTLRFQITGPAFAGTGGGPLWLDAKDGSIVEAAWRRPNHPGYTDFRLRLKGRSEGPVAWTRLLERHYEGCPATP